MSSAAQRRFLHVANGACTTRLIEAAGLPGVCSIWADPLYEGPAGLSDGELLEVRTRFLSTPDDLWRTVGLGSDPALDPANDLSEWRRAIDRDKHYDELILWFEHDLFDQLNLIQLLTWIEERAGARKPVSLICIGSYPGRPGFKGLGELTPEEIGSLLATRQPVGRPQYDLARRAWDAFRQPTPAALDKMRHADTSALPYLAAAITRFLQEYPWTRDGLSRTERRLLELATGSGMPLSSFGRLHEGEREYYVTDATVAATAESLARTSPALLTLDVSAPAENSALRGTVAITRSGRAVLAGEIDRIAACGIDRWLGGVHLQGRSVPWRWDDARQQVVASGA